MTFLLIGPHCGKNCFFDEASDIYQGFWAVLEGQGGNIWVEMCLCVVYSFGLVQLDFGQVAEAISAA